MVDYSDCNLDYDYIDYGLVKKFRAFKIFKHLLF